ncbi:hypothetical protein [Neorhizobium petrolearium]|uniref:hypothetical protein n=1 Tax=Neorhizobium petrolearium TaxID=515361 RepID=UPI003F7E384E
MRLADEITVTIAKEAVTLRPSLRYAIQLERRPGSFRQLTRDIMDGSLTAAVDIIRPHCDLDYLENRILDALPELQAPLLQYVMACAGLDRDDAPKAANTGKPAKAVPFHDYLQELYKIATGWLGWDPDTALDATPAEIQLAYEGRLDLLKSIFGGSEKPESNLSLGDKLKVAFGTFGTKKIIKKVAA